MRKRILTFLCVLSMCVVNIMPVHAEEEEEIATRPDISTVLDEIVPESRNTRTTSSDYRTWQQADPAWGNIRLGTSSYTMKSSGCLITSVTKLIVQSGLREASDFTPGTFVNLMNANGGFTSSGSMYWAKPGECVPGFTYSGKFLEYSSGGYSPESYASKIISWIEEGYHLVLSVNYNGHWVAVDEAKTLATGEIYMMDSVPGNANADIKLSDRYAKFNQAVAFKGGTTPTVPSEPTEPVEPTLNVEGAFFPDSIQQGKGYASSGTIVSNEKITWAWVGIYDVAGGRYILYDEIIPNAETYDISLSTCKLDVATLPYGTYKFCVSATTESGLNRSRMIEKEFTVTKAKKITFDMQGGTVEEAFAEYNAIGMNDVREDKSLVVYNNANAVVHTDANGYEALVESNGQVTKIRTYGNTSTLTIPTDGMVVSGHYTKGTDCGADFVKQLSEGDYVGFDMQTMTVYGYDNQNAYLANHKYVVTDETYGELPVPEKDGYIFEGWYTEKTGGEKVNSESIYCVNTLYAHWSKDLEELAFSGASLTLQDNLTINFKAKANLFAEDGYENPYVIFNLNGVETVVSEYTVEGENVVFDFRNIAPNQMNDVISATLCAEYDDVKYESETRQYSVSTYCNNMLSKYSADKYAKLRTLLVDLLNYGAQSQIYTDYRTDALVNANLTKEQKAWGTAKDREWMSVQEIAYESIKDPSVIWKGAGLNLKDRVEMRLVIEAESIKNLSVKVTSESGGEWTIPSAEFEYVGKGRYYIYFSGLNSAQMSEPVYFTVCHGDTVVSNTIRYSIESYAYAQANKEVSDESLLELLKAMMKYGDAAYHYVN